ncbi:transposase [Gluconacetobacter azotocaptans]|nr:transposase [Gluconacetobacter azotocaptans]
MGGSRGGLTCFSRWVFRQRNLVECFFKTIEQFRGVATRYKRPDNYLAAVKLIAARSWCRCFMSRRPEQPKPCW